MHSVTVIIPTHNPGAHLHSAVRSAVEQSVPPERIILVDDGSDESYHEFIESMLSESGCIELVRQTNSGCPAARNTGLKLATTGFVAFLDHDDVWHRDFLQTVLSPLAEGDLAAGFCCVQHMRHDGRLVDKFSQRKKEFPGIGDFLSSDPTACGSSSVYRRECLDEVGGFDPEWKYGEIPELYCRLFKNGWRVRHGSEILVFYRNTHGSMAGSSLLYKYRRRLLRKVLAGQWLHRARYEFRLLWNIVKIRMRRAYLG
jgi:glycosyltransferase involved in cell wall biosynthesis